MGVSVKEIGAYFDEVIPRSLSEVWDNDGIIIECDSDVDTAVMALDVTSEVVEYAKSVGASLIVTHHPLFFGDIKSLRCSESMGKRAIAAVKANVSVLSYHTRLDAVAGGVNDVLAGIIGLKDCVPFADELGRVGYLEKEMTLDEFAAYIKGKINNKTEMRLDCGKTVKRVALLGGSGKKYLESAALTGADTYLTGELNYSAMLDATEYGLNLLCATHYATEAVVLKRLEELLNKRFPQIKTFIKYV